MKKQTKKETTSSSKISENETDLSSYSQPTQDSLFEDKELPGYPHYPTGEDIMNPGNDMEKMELSEEKISQPASSGDKKRSVPKSEENKSSELDVETDEEEIGTEDDYDEANITDEDLIALDDDGLNPQEGDDDQLRKRSVPVDMSGDDLDVPGSELDDEEEMTGGEDEENNSYSIGGDRHDDLEENGTEEAEEKF